jgi:hypothetical protein
VKLKKNFPQFAALLFFAPNLNYLLLIRSFKKSNSRNLLIQKYLLHFVNQLILSFCCVRHFNNHREEQVSILHYFLNLHLILIYFILIQTHFLDYKFITILFMVCCQKGDIHLKFLIRCFIYLVKLWVLMISFNELFSLFFK